MDLAIDPNNFEQAFQDIDAACVELRVRIRNAMDRNQQMSNEEIVTLDLDRTRLNTIINNLEKLGTLAKTSFANKDHIKSRLDEMVETINEIESHLK